MPANLTRHLPLLLGLACISLTSTAWSATCNKPNVKGYQYVGCLKDGLAGVGKDYNTPRKLDQKIVVNKIE